MEDGHLLTNRQEYMLNTSNNNNNNNNSVIYCLYYIHIQMDRFVINGGFLYDQRFMAGFDAGDTPCTGVSGDRSSKDRR